MVKCPNCGQDSDGYTCPSCDYPLQNDPPKKRYPLIFGRPLKPKPKKEAEGKKLEEKRAKEELKKAEKKAKEEAKRAKKLAREAEKAEKEAEAAISALKKGEEEAKADEAKAAEVAQELYEGIAELVFPPPVDLERLRRIEERLREIEEVKLLWSGGSEEGAALAIAIQKPMPLSSLLEKVGVEVLKIEKKGSKVILRLRIPQAPSS